eukprot:15270-Pelagomonas_calceolata.AAC.2
MIGHRVQPLCEKVGYLNSLGPLGVQKERKDRLLSPSLAACIKERSSVLLRHADFLLLMFPAVGGGTAAACRPLQTH